MSVKNSSRALDSKWMRLFKRCVSTTLILYSLIAIYLIGNTVLSSFKSKAELIENTMGFPREFTLGSFRKVLVDDGFLRYFANSLLLVSVSIVLLLAVASMLAYGMTRYRFKGRAFLENYFLFGLMFPIQLGILPIFVILNVLQLNNNLFGLALLYTSNLSFPFLIFSKFFKSLPLSVLESARIDGASEWQCYLRIVLPMSKPILFTVGLINFVSIWNDFYFPLVFLTQKQVRTLTLAVYNYSADFLSNWDKIFAAASVSLLPMIVIYFLFSEQIVAGLTGGAVKE